MVPSNSMAMGPRMPMMANGMPQMVAPPGYMGKSQLLIQKVVGTNP